MAKDHNPLKTDADVAQLIRWLDEVDFTTTINVWQGSPPNPKWQVNINRGGEPGWVIGIADTLPEAFANAFNTHRFRLDKETLRLRKRSQPGGYELLPPLEEFKEQIEKAKKKPPPIIEDEWEEESGDDWDEE